MTKETLTKNIAYEKLQEFFNGKPLVLFGTGTSCAVDIRFGMVALRDHLSMEIPKKTITPEQTTEWNSVLEKLNRNVDFESAMNSIKEEELLKTIVCLTAEFISGIDQENTPALFKGQKEWPPTKLFKKLVDGLPETDRKLHVATPNYDLLAEYAFEGADISYITGYVGGICRELDWKQSVRAVTYTEKKTSKKKVNRNPQLRKHIRLYKVHGSLNTFQWEGKNIENNSWISKPPPGIERVMITPGTSKYQLLHKYRDELLREYDEAIKNHTSFLFLGFGFNDSQLIHNKLKTKLKTHRGLIITRDLNDSIMKVLKECHNVWLVCKHEDDGNDSTRIYNQQYADWLYIEDKGIWKADEFTTEILGD
jgi:hypothetical protein